MMFVDPQTRFLVANQADANGTLKPEGTVFIGSLPKDQNVSNTATTRSWIRSMGAITSNWKKEPSPEFYARTDQARTRTALRGPRSRFATASPTRTLSSTTKIAVSFHGARTPALTSHQ